MLERLVLPKFFLLLAVAGAVAEWTLVCWLLGPFGFRPAGVLHVVAPGLLCLAMWLPAWRAEGVASKARPRHAILVVAFAAVVSVAALAAAAGVWSALRVAGAIPAEAGMVAGGGQEPFFGPVFRSLALVVVALTGGLLAYGYRHGYRRLAVTTLRVPIPGLDPALDGLRLVQVSDLHLGALADRAVLREQLARVAALAPDLVCVTGDIVDSPATDLEAWIPELAALTAPLGVFAILGNHDVRSAPDRIVEALGHWTRWHVLRDEVAVVERGAARLHLIGLEHRFRVRAAALPALATRIPAGEPAVLLAHHPDVFPAAAAAGIGLVLAGHTHGGQLAVPGLPHANVARLLLSRFDSGTFVRGSSVLHVNRGLGTSGQRVRVGAPPEITVITLVSVDSPSVAL